VLDDAEQDRPGLARVPDPPGPRIEGSPAHAECVLELQPMSDARLILTCGLPGAGKTTLARRLAAERAAVRLTKDAWQRALGSSPWDRDVGERIEGELWCLAQELLSLGLSVVLDFGLWARAERDELRAVARSLGVGIEGR
jgi:predicted kinase